MGNCLASSTQRVGILDSDPDKDGPATEKTGLIPSSGASYNVRRETVVSQAETSHKYTNGTSKPLLSASAISSSSHTYQPSEYDHVSTLEPTTTFQYLDRNYSLETPSCLIPHVNELFKSICERYDIAVTNREKIDEALQLFKKILEVDLALPMVDCFSAWKSQLTSPKFTIDRSELSGDVKKITVRAEEVPRLKRKAQKHVRDLLDACHLFLQQRDFLKKQITNDLEELDRITKDIPALCKGVSLSSSERKHMPQVVKRARDQFVQFPGTIDWFWNQIFALMHDINAAVHVLQDGQ